MSEQCKEDIKLNIIKIYTIALNDIDDYFEYSNKSSLDRHFIKSVLSDMNEKLSKLNDK